ncbi:MAG: DUF86 domain-containing protein [Candidatus Hydrogenedens sp.]|nr:DUF86 domain-containing protein [Candidatus Hydrogenedentota bacterium]NLF56706.1 DUF86 domain-containing protein [Candidatus Hydrogenedens sp.]
MPPEADQNRVRHMLEAACQAISFVNGRSRADLEADTQLRFAVLRALEVLGEAAGRVSPETRAAHPEIPWQLAVGMRNRLVHAYFEVNLDIVWTTVTRTLPALVPGLEAVLDLDEKR